MKQNRSTYIEDTLCPMNSLNTAYMLHDCRTLAYANEAASFAQKHIGQGSVCIYVM